ncbi:ABC transporter ATP-binding protein [Aneurinibacillus sp. REN35]|uniref:ABC transporter ATP-binding protein n=1 Tax=Aneurinibacillus sp. REN35 TaxID=3237286 RepID=UPI003527999B
MRSALTVQDLHVTFKTYAGELHAVRGVTFHVNKGETLAIVGESGSGKSVTSKAIMRLLPRDTSRINQGTIFFGDQELGLLSDKEMESIRGSKIAMIFQDPMTSLNPTMTIGKQIAESLRKHTGKSKKEALARAIELLKLVGIPNAEARISQYPHQFSGGMRQRVVIAMALSCNPDILIADEPTTALDVTIQAQILDLLKDIQKKTGNSIIIITHDLGVVANVADRVAVMYAGKIVETGTVHEIFYKARHPYTWGLLGSMPDTDRDKELYTIPGSPPDLLYPPKGDAFAVRNEYALAIDYELEPPLYQISETHYAATWLLHEKAPHIEPPIKVQTRKDASQPSIVQFPKSEVEKEALLQVRNLQKYFTVGKNKVLKAVDNVTFDIYQGETLGLVGESGCGKSTTGRTILQLYKATAGEIFYKDIKLHEKLHAEEQKAVNRNIQMIFQDPYASLNPRKTVADIIAEGLDIHGLVSGKKKRMERVHELLETVGLQPSHAGRYAHEFSGGQRQRIGIARALAVEPEFIIADEPISALDVSIQAQVVNLLKKLQRERGLTYLFIAHDLSMVRYISDRVGVMYLGNLVELADTDELYTNPLHPYTQALLSAAPIPNPEVERTRQRIVLEGELPSPINPGQGCRFYSRCPKAHELCGQSAPLWKEVKEKHWVSCHLF